MPYDLDEPNDGQVFRFDDRFNARSPHPWPSATEEARAGNQAPQFFNQGRRVEIARGFARGNQYVQ